MLSNTEKMSYIIHCHAYNIEETIHYKLINIDHIYNYHSLGIYILPIIGNVIKLKYHIL